MAFKIDKAEFVNRTFRMPKKLVDMMEYVCNQKNISMNKLVLSCIEYALNDLEEED